MNVCEQINKIVGHDANKTVLGIAQLDLEQ